MSNLNRGDAAALIATEMTHYRTAREAGDRPSGWRALVPPGSLTGRLPMGNTGRARISAFRSMPVPADLASLISPHDRPASR